MRPAPTVPLNTLLVAISLLVHSSSVRADPKPPDEIAWERSALPPDDATDLEKPMFVDIGTAWCGPCATMHETTYRDPKIVDAAASFTTVRIDADQQEGVAVRFKVKRVPTLLFLDRRGEEITRISGYVPAPKLHKVMSTIARLLADSTPTDAIRNAIGAALSTPGR